MGGRYKVIESVGHAVQAVHSYEDLEKHHPTWKEDPAKRHYGDIDGRREEFVLSPSGERMVSKDFVLTSDGSAAVGVPSPVEGYVHRSPKLDRWGTVQIYDGPGKDARLIAQVRHMEPIHVADGQHVQYGQALGQQGSKSPAGTRVGLHTHMDVAESHMKEFKQYVQDLDSGAITQNGHSRRSVVQDERQVHARHQGAGHHEDGAVRDLQHALDRLGYRDAHGQTLKIDGDYGDRTKQAVMAFQRAHGLHVDGIVGRDTRDALTHAGQVPLLSERSHPDHPLFREALEGIRTLPKGTLRGETEEHNVAAALAQRAKEGGISHIDHVLMNTRGDGMFAVQGDPQNPARHVVSIDKGQATAQSVEQSTAELAAHSITRQQTTQVQVQAEQMEYRNGFSVGMRP